MTEVFQYTLPADLASQIRTTARCADMETSTLCRILVKLGLVVDQMETNGESVVIKKGETEDSVRIIGNRSLPQRIFDRTGFQRVKPESALTVTVPTELASIIEVIARRERMPAERLIEEMLGNSLRIVNLQSEPETSVVIKNKDSSEKVLSNIIPKKLQS